MKRVAADAEEEIDNGEMKKRTSGTLPTAKSTRNVSHRLPRKSNDGELETSKDDTEPDLVGAPRYAKGLGMTLVVVSEEEELKEAATAVEGEKEKRKTGTEQNRKKQELDYQVASEEEKLTPQQHHHHHHHHHHHQLHPKKSMLSTLLGSEDEVMLLDHSGVLQRPATEEIAQIE